MYVKYIILNTKGIINILDWLWKFDNRHPIIISEIN